MGPRALHGVGREASLCRVPPHGGREGTSSKVHRAASQAESGVGRGKADKGDTTNGGSERWSSCGSLLAGVPASAQKR